MTADRAAFVAATDVSRETLDRLDLYAQLLKKWNPRINLVAPATLPALWTRHFRDSAQLFRLAPLGVTRWADFGSGGGFPGMVVAILAAETPLEVTLVESDQRKAAFLRTVARETSVTVTVRAQRLEATRALNAQVVSARALAPLPKLLDHCARHLAPDGTALLPKGARHADEIAKALETWSFHCEKVPSETDDSAVILQITELARE